MNAPLKPGRYRIFWKNGNVTVATVGMCKGGGCWLAHKPGTGPTVFNAWHTIHKAILLTKEPPMTWNTTNNTVSTSSGDVGVTIAKLKEQIAELKMSLEANMAPIPITVDVAPPNKWGGPSAKWGAYFKSTSYATSHATSSVADFKDKSKIPPLLYHPSQEEE